MRVDSPFYVCRARQLACLTQRWSRPGFRSWLTAAEVCAGPGSADVEHKQVGRKSINFKELKSKYYSPHCYLDTKCKFKRLLEARYMCRN